MPALVLVVACGDKAENKTSSTAGTGADGGADAAAPAGPTGSAGEDVQPVYPVDPKAPPVPIAAKLCEALHAMPEKKRAACCASTPGVVMTTECTRTLSAAIRAKAVTVSEVDVEACAAAWDKALEGCDWVGPFAPAPPAACRGVVKGALAAGATCRSSLECQGSLRCLGAGPTTTGRCGSAKADGDVCGGTVDALATFTRDGDLDKQHPECAHTCIRHKCATPAAEGSACRTTGDCQEGLSCLAKKCTQAPVPSSDGAPCPGGACTDGLSCIRGKCTARKSAGEACTDDFECRGGCLKSGGPRDRGTCGPRCDVR